MTSHHGYDVQQNAVGLQDTPPTFIGGAPDQQRLIGQGQEDSALTTAGDTDQTLVKTTVRPETTTRDATDAQPVYMDLTPTQLAERQRRDPELRFIINLLERGAEKPTWDSVELQSADVKSICHEWDRLSLRDGVLCRKWTGLHDSEIIWQIIMPRDCRETFISFVHSAVNGGHMGRAKTQLQVQRRAYWPGWRNQVANQLKTCSLCAEYHRGTSPRQNKLHPFGSGEPFECIAVDITGRHPTSRCGKQYIVTVIDMFSRWAEAYAVSNHTAPVVAQVLLDNWFCRFGVPRRLLSDQGTEFQSQLFTELCNRLGIDKIRSSPYKPSTNGQIERFHRTLNAMIAKIIDADHRNWDRMLSTVIAAYRATVHASTGYSPNRLILNRENCMPIDLVLGKIVEEAPNYESYDEFVLDQQERLRTSYQLAREHLGAAAERRKNDYDTKVKEVSFKPGNWVYYYVPRHRVNHSAKWTRMYTGPFAVVEYLPPNDYVIGE